LMITLFAATSNINKSSKIIKKYKVLKRIKKFLEVSKVFPNKLNWKY
jgi:hypothetical protein